MYNCIIQKNTFVYKMNNNCILHTIIMFINKCFWIQLYICIQKYFCIQLYILYTTVLLVPDTLFVYKKLFLFIHRIQERHTSYLSLPTLALFAFFAFFAARFIPLAASCLTPFLVFLWWVFSLITTSIHNSSIPVHKQYIYSILMCSFSAMARNDFDVFGKNRWSREGIRRQLFGSRKATKAKYQDTDI